MSTLQRLREVGLTGALRAAGRRAGTRVRGLLLNRARRRRPLRATPAEVSTALGGLSPTEALRGPALAALPTVAAFERSLGDLGEADRGRLLERADAVAAHRFDLLGSGPVDLGAEIDWSIDFKSGRRWPLKHGLLLMPEAFFFDESDVKVPWELSRFQHLPLLAAAFRLSGERRYLDEIGAQLDGWIAANPVEIGVNWLCTMDVAIRAANWVAALAICAGQAAEQPWGERAMESLLLHGRFIRGHLETAEARTNHYLSDVAGLIVVAALFSRGEEGAAWGRWAVDELIAEMEHQVREDGCGHEASIPYHRLVSELFLCGTQAGESLHPGAFPGWYLERLGRMLEFTAAYTRPDGLAPQIGDNDDGRFLPLAEYGKADFRSHLHLFGQASRPYEPATRSIDFPAGGYYTMRHGDLYVLVRCGDTGVYGIGGHAHNDQLSFELCCGDTPLIEDPGTGTYYESEEERLRFRATGFHATLRIDGAEQNELPPYPRFPLGDRSRAEAISWEPGPERTAFAGRHHGFEALPAAATHERRLELDGPRGELRIVDTVASDAAHRLEWTFPLGRGGQVSIRDGAAVADFGAVRLSIAVEGAELEVVDGAYSPAYGVTELRPFISARGSSAPGRHSTEIHLKVEQRE
jgi:Heparinase II/III-like protein/Heparinase II/III N-terminus